MHFGSTSILCRFDARLTLGHSQNRSFERSDSVTRLTGEKTGLLRDGIDEAFMRASCRENISSFVRTHRDCNAPCRRSACTPRTPFTICVTRRWTTRLARESASFEDSSYCSVMSFTISTVAIAAASSRFGWKPNVSHPSSVRARGSGNACTWRITNFA